MQRQTGIIPEALSRRPELEGPLRWWLDVFYQLSAGRQITMGGAGPIPLTEILAFTQLYGIDTVDDRAFFLARVSFLDGVYLAHTQKKTAAKS